MEQAIGCWGIEIDGKAVDGSSLALLVLCRLVDAEAMRAVLGVHDDCLLGVLFDMASVDHLAEQVGGGLALVCLVFEPLDLSTELGQLDNCAGVLYVLVCSCLLVGLHLCLSAAPLAPRLQHVGPNALRHYQVQIKMKIGESFCTYG